ncbi:MULTISPECIES: fluoride efflux transporter CrcB [unclassified Desulfovibrio]|uniref:fluoride efflux transporter CrcB n=1 Tax=unclassified Desulfovibrio TaxID=2593640 RepID=UPI002FDB472D
MLKTLVLISIGASCGAVLRWFLGVMLNAVFLPIPLGTLAANLLGGYLIGVAVSVFNALPTVGPEMRLLVITGFLGGLTTFSTFTAEIGALLQGQRVMTAVAAIALHVGGSLIMMLLGMGTFAFLRSCFR